MSEHLGIDTHSHIASLSASSSRSSSNGNRDSMSVPTPGHFSDPPNPNPHSYLPPFLAEPKFSVMRPNILHYHPLLARIDSVLDQLPFSHSRSNQACIILALLIALGALGHKWGLRHWLRKRQEIISEKNRLELLAADDSNVKSDSRTQSTPKNTNTEGKRARSTSIAGKKDKSNNQRPTTARERSISSAKMPSTPVKKDNGHLHPKSATVSTPSSVGNGNANAFIKTTNDGSSSSPEYPENEIKTQAGSHGLPNGEARNSDPSEKPAQEFSDSSDIAFRRPSADSETAESLTTTIVSDYAFPEKTTSSSLGLSLGRPAEIHIPASPGTVSTPASRRPSEPMPAFPPSLEEEETIRQRQKRPSQDRRPSTRVPVGAPGWTRDANESVSPAASIASLPSTSESKSPRSKGSTSSSDALREKDEALKRVHKLQSQLEAAKEREKAARKQAARHKEEASHAFNECVQAREDISRARLEADRSHAREQAIHKEFNDLKRDLLLRDQEHRRRLAEVSLVDWGKECEVLEEILTRVAFHKLETLLQQRSAQLAQAYHTLMLAQPSATTSPFPMASPFPHVPSPIPPSPQLMLSGQATFPSRLSFSDSASPLTPASPLMMVGNQMPRTSDPDVSRDIASSVLKQRKDTGPSVKVDDLPASRADVTGEQISPTRSDIADIPLVFASVHHDAEEVQAYVEAERGRRASRASASAPNVPSLSRSSSTSNSATCPSPQQRSTDVSNLTTEPIVRADVGSSGGSSVVGDDERGFEKEEKLP